MIPALMPNYKRADLAFEQGEGVWLTAADGRRYLDFGAGIAVSSLGHAHPGLVHAIATQAAKVMHVSNLYRVPQAEALASLLVNNTFADSVLFCNSGAEANEGMVKLIRRAQFKLGHPERTRILCFDGAFHGRTLAMISATGNPAYQEGFGPVVEGFDHAPFNNTNTLRAAITPETAGIIVEPVQGESGIKPATQEFMQGLRAACDEHGLFLGFDEVQTGVGRTGKLFAHEWYGVKPDVISVAKGIGGGFPLGAVLATEELAQFLTPGTHGTTYGGNPLACAAGMAVLEEILKPGFLEHVRAVGEAFGALLDAVTKSAPDVFDSVRGIGLMRGLHCKVPVGEVMAAATEQGLLSVSAGDNVLRLVPPLIVTEDECREACDRLVRAADAICEAKLTTQEKVS
ncbi:aspartate aminotransferase family protein [Gluconobacter wancherniae]|uniref:Acetylornithine aminotransferase n=1 Tax=Gluconobacter wancherniae NBRC 103581 TaxID=656744 RepID=A0A511B1U5_9PROT|nr:aspartate aminotransferase family protein [Gluconobacter wancherniae]MBF0854393.1 aspartate aminotransferase family protein [Gluconobacter wancherniae]MBS1088475.1 aspartate aminotransferase family protein [Gluconobacter wancherniae]MBS1094923.1 aspartate aminotransferase family protein [Gluconobacter wancherniae]GBD57454.1 acetylornithine aminotransferase [Gluconobacter wancherniae NBRC 103581]GBR62690.1 acetylornithine/succinylornithine aminotransferase [Gluconobacter wancherniae NBRC 103